MATIWRTMRHLGAVTGALLLALASVDAQSLRLQQTPIPLMDGYPVARMVRGDVDGDGLPDVAAITFQSQPDLNIGDKVLVQFQQTTAGASAEFGHDLVLPALAPQSLLLCDLDGDGDLDIAVAQDDATDALALWLNEGPGVGLRVVFRRLQLRLGYDLAAAVVAYDADANPATPADLLLVRGLGRPSVLLRNQLAGATPALSERQLLGHPDAIGALSADFDDDGHDDLLVYGNGCVLWRRHDATPQSMLDSSTLATCNGRTVFAAAARDFSPAPGTTGVALGTASGDLWLVISAWLPGQNPTGWSSTLTTTAAGISQEFAFIDADGDGLDDLVAARRNEGAALAQRGSPVYRRTPDQSFGSELQRLAPAWTALSLGTSPSGVPRLAVGHATAGSGVWQPAPAGTGATVALTASDLYVKGTSPLAFLTITPSTQAAITSIYVDAVSSTGTHATLVSDLGPGIRTTTAQASGVVTGDFETWALTLSEVAPATAATIVAPSTATLHIVPPLLPPQTCFLEAFFFLVNRGGAQPLTTGPAGADPLPLLRRLRDERMATSAGGQHYVGLYQSLQADLYVAAFADTSFWALLWDLNQAWTPAIANLVDGDGQMPVSPQMVDLLDRSLARFQAHGSAALTEAIAHERAALDLASLAGQPIAALQQRWETSPLYADGFD